MELFTRESRSPTPPTQVQSATATTLTPLNTAVDCATQTCPSPVRARTPVGTVQQTSVDMLATLPNGAEPVPAGVHGGNVSPGILDPGKWVTFILKFKDPAFQARLPLRIFIRPGDPTEGIISTVKNFWGLYSGPTMSMGVLFEDKAGNALIAGHDNFEEGMPVYVRVIEEPLGPGYRAALGLSEAFYGAAGYNHDPRPTSRMSRLRSPSPNGARGRRSTPTGANGTAVKNGRSRSSKNRSQVNGDGHGDSFNGYSSGDAASASSGRAKEQLGNTDISVENIVEGGRRKRAKFESTELPLFAPPQMPAATSNPAISPVRRFDFHRGSLPNIPPGQNPFSNPQHSHQYPQVFSMNYVHHGMYATPSSEHRRAQADQEAMTPDPTVTSGVSDEDKDVAMQLMYMSTNGRASASTQDDTFSGRADASSGSETSDADGEDEMSAARRQRLDASGSHRKVVGATEGHLTGPRYNTEAGNEDADSSDELENGTMAAPTSKSSKSRANTLNGSKARPQSGQKTKATKTAKPNTKKAPSVAGPMTPASLPASRKHSIASSTGFLLGPGEEEQPDLSTKPRCQRCRKSKKGCDRQRPCGRCRDAGIPAELCISEDEGNGRKGRYGRHMGVPIRKEDMPPPATNLLPAAPIAPDALALAAAAPGLDKIKKRKK